MTTIDGSDLVAAKKGVDRYGGAPLLQDSLNVSEDLDKGDDVGAGIDSALVALDLLGVMMDPFGALFGEVAGFIIEHVGFLNQFMDDLTGDPQGIEAASETWKNISAKLIACGQQYDAALSSVSAEWSDAAASAYTAVAKDYIGTCYAVGGYAELFSEGITVAGMLCAKTRQDVYDAIGDFITDMVIEGLAALATSWCSFGGSLAAWICAMEVQGDLVAASISEKIASLLGRLGKFAAKYAKDASKFAELGDKLTGASKEFKDGATSLRKEGDELKDRAGHIGEPHPKGQHRAPTRGNDDGGTVGHPSEPGRHRDDSGDSGDSGADGNPVEKTHHGADVGLRGAHDENKTHNPKQRDEGEGGGGEGGE